MSTIAETSRSKRVETIESSEVVIKLLSDALASKRLEINNRLRAANVSPLKVEEPRTIAKNLFLETNLAIEKSPLSLDTLASVVDVALRSGQVLNLDPSGVEFYVLINAFEGYVIFNVLKGAGSAIEKKSEKIVASILDLPGKVIKDMLSATGALRLFLPKPLPEDKQTSSKGIRKKSSAKGPTKKTNVKKKTPRKGTNPEARSASKRTRIK